MGKINKILNSARPEFEALISGLLDDAKAAGNDADLKDFASAIATDVLHAFRAGHTDLGGEFSAQALLLGEIYRVKLTEAARRRFLVTLNLVFKTVLAVIA